MKAQTRIRAAWRNAYRAARLGFEVALHFGPKRNGKVPRDHIMRHGFIVRPGGPSAWGHMGCDTAGADYGRWLGEHGAQSARYRAWYLRELSDRIPHPFLP